MLLLLNNDKTIQVRQNLNKVFMHNKFVLPVINLTQILEVYDLFCIIYSFFFLRFFFLENKQELEIKITLQQQAIVCNSVTVIYTIFECTNLNPNLLRMSRHPMLSQYKVTKKYWVNTHTQLLQTGFCKLWMYWLSTGCGLSLISCSV